jgi:hypothetical protein
LAAHCTRAKDTMSGLEIALGVLPVVTELTERASNMFSGLVLGSRQFRNSSMQVMELYVERARLEVLGQLIMTKGIKYSDAEVRSLVRMLRQLTEEIEKSNRLFRKYDQSEVRVHKLSEVKVQSVYNLLKWATRDEQRLSDQIKSIHLLVDSLTDLVTSVMAKNQAKDQKRARNRNKPRGSSASLEAEPISTSPSRIFQTWNVTVDSLDQAVGKLVRDLDVRRSFAEASINLKIWASGFDFDIENVDHVLDDNEELQEGVLEPFRILMTLLSM